MKPIGIIRSPFKKKSETPIQPWESKAIGEIELFKEFSNGLEGIKGFSHIILVYAFHKSNGFKLKAKPFLDNKKKGVFATRAPSRPNPIGLSVVELVERNGNTLKVKGIDCLDGTPLLDIKPFIPEFDNAKNVRIGWLEKILKKGGRKNEDCNKRKL